MRGRRQHHRVDRDQEPLTPWRCRSRWPSCSSSWSRWCSTTATASTTPRTRSPPSSARACCRPARRWCGRRSSTSSRSRVFGVHVAKTIAKGTVDPAVVTPAIVLAALARRAALEHPHLVAGPADVVVARAHRRRSSARRMVAAGPQAVVTSRRRSRPSPSSWSRRWSAWCSASCCMLVVMWIFRRSTPAARGHAVPPAAAGLGRGVQPRARLQRRAEDRRHHHRAAVLHRPPDRRVPRPVLGRALAATARSASARCRAAGAS